MLESPAEAFKILMPKPHTGPKMPATLGWDRVCGVFFFFLSRQEIPLGSQDCLRQSVENLKVHTVAGGAC